MDLFKFNKIYLSFITAVAIFFPFADSHAASTTITLTVAGGGLSISAPASGTFGTVASPSDATLEMGAITVTDARGASAGSSWTATAFITALTHSDGTTTIPATLFRYTAGIPTKTGTVTLTELAATAFDSAASVVSAASITGNNSAVWTPRISVPVPSGTLHGTYNGTITHSVT
jgi:hypothetical protein